MKTLKTVSLIHKQIVVRILYKSFFSAQGYLRLLRRLREKTTLATCYDIVAETLGHPIPFDKLKQIGTP